MHLNKFLVICLLFIVSVIYSQVYQPEDTLTIYEDGFMILCTAVPPPLPAEELRNLRSKIQQPYKLTSKQQSWVTEVCNRFESRAGDFFFVQIAYYGSVNPPVIRFYILVIVERVSKRKLFVYSCREHNDHYYDTWEYFE